MDKKCCDSYKWYYWYWDKCEKYQCRVDCNSWEERENKKSEDK